jgi:pyrimidine-nucleoside phosphorylase/thymidine phosphorylase
MEAQDLLYGMRTGEEQPDDAIEGFVRGVTDGTVSRPQAAAWLAWAFRRGLSDRETVALTRAMTRSGEVLAWEEGPEIVDKHSTGGVGDKVSLPLAALWAELGSRVPMISGRGLGFTGGTLDKLESIPGYRTDLPVGRLREILRETRCFITGQTGDLAPADRVLYALRNETCTVESIPLIVGSILSKKLAAGVRRLVLDVKTGSGAFMQRLEDSLGLARALVAVARGSGQQCSAAITEMGRPLGRMCGNGLEVVESVACQRGAGPPELRALVLELAGHPGAAAVLDSGRAFERFARMVEAQGGDPRALDDPRRLGLAGTEQQLVRAQRSGFVERVDARRIGVAVFELGAGRRQAADAIDPGVGIELHVALGDPIREGEPLATLRHRNRSVPEALAHATSAFAIGEERPTIPPLVHQWIR